MTANKKRPSDLVTWDGDLNANLHVRRPGASMKVSLQEIVDSVPVPTVPTVDTTAINEAIATNEASVV